MSKKHWKLGIVGWPMGYSLSPLMHNYALQSAGLEGDYKEYKVEPEKLPAWLASEALELDGFNVTMPYKTAVWELLREREEVVAGTLLLQAVNTVIVRGGRMSACNTDGEGFLSAFPNAGLELKDSRVVVLGSGGAAKSIVFALLESEISQLTIWNRKEHLDRAESLAGQLNSLRWKADFIAQATADPDALPITECHLLVNATPMGMKRHDEVPETILKRIHGVQTVYDIIYEPRETALIQAARRAGAKAITGDVMLAGQGAAAFELWTGVRWMQPVMKQALDEHFRDR